MVPILLTAFFIWPLSTHHPSPALLFSRRRKEGERFRLAVIDVDLNTYVCMYICTYARRVFWGRGVFWQCFCARSLRGLHKRSHPRQCLLTGRG